jgi:hypothetical protein
MLPTEQAQVLSHSIRRYDMVTGGVIAAHLSKAMSLLAQAGKERSAELWFCQPVTFIISVLCCAARGRRERATTGNR